MKLSSIDIYFLVSEMKVLEGGRVDKIYHPSKEELLFQFHVPSIGKKLLRYILGKYIFLSEFKGQYDEPSGFCMFLRKKLGNKRITRIEQIGSERVVALSFDTLTLYFELFGQGNVVLVEEGIILNALTQKKWKDRVIYKGEPYVFPRKDFDLFSIGKSDFFSQLPGGKEIVLSLAKDLGMGGKYAEEACTIAEIDKKRIRLKDDEKEALYKAVQKLLKRKISAAHIIVNGVIKDIDVFAKTVQFPSLSAAYDSFFTQTIAQTFFVSKHQSAIDKVQGIVDQQLTQLESLEKKAKENYLKGELIYSNYVKVEEVLREINAASSKMPFDEIQKKIKGHKLVKDVNGKDKTVVISL